MISFKQLSYALALGRTLHFKQAASDCNISQSALSTALAELEKQLGLKLFERDNKKVLITPIGEEVLARAQQIVQQVEALEQFGTTILAPLSYPIKVGLIPTIAPYLLPKLLPELKRQYPHCELTIVEEQSAEVLKLVRQGELDTAIIALPYPCEGLLSFEFWEEDFYWVGLDEPALANKQEILSAELADRNLMLLKDGHCLKDHILDVCQIPKQSANQGFGATSLNTLIQMAVNGLGSTLIPAMAISSLTANYPQLQCIHLNENSPHRRLAFLVRPNYTRLNSVEALVGVCKSCLAKEELRG